MYNSYLPVENPENGEILGSGWLPPFPDMRDYTEGHEEIAAMIKTLTALSGEKKNTPKALPPKVDLRQWCSPIENQGSLGSCTAHAAVGILEYFEKKAFNTNVDLSRLFVYYNTRRMMRVQIGVDSGAWLRNTMGSLAHCGVSPEVYWNYTDDKTLFDIEPPNFVYAVAGNYKALKYFCHDPIQANVPAQKILETVKMYLAQAIPSMFGFFGFPSFGYGDIKGGIPYPCPGEKAIWGHAIAAVGYDDGLKITNKKCNKTTTGALLIRNSWGTSWGDKGYGWLPYDYVLSRFAMDFWSLLQLNWIESKQFRIF